MAQCIDFEGVYARKDSTCSLGLVVMTQDELADLKRTIKIDSATDPQRVADMQAMFYGFILALVVVWGAKQLLNLFSGDTSRD